MTKYLLTALLATGLLVTAPQAAIADDEGKAITIADIDRAVGKLKRAVCALKNDSTFLNKARYTLAVEEEREKLEEMKASLEAEGRASELRHLISAMSKASKAVSC